MSAATLPAPAGSRPALALPSPLRLGLARTRHEVRLFFRERDAVFRWLDHAYEERDGSLVLVTSAIEFDPVRSDPRFAALLKRMGLGR